MEDEIVVHVELNFSPAGARREVVEGKDATVISITRAKVVPRSQWARMAVEQLGLQGKVDIELPAGEAMEIHGRIKEAAERLHGR